ncbi:MAG: hypothetical protein A2138_18405 [Deltaproteobacteria bacterium RBG_16_71_12]|nr:MAG: hypothetical protein A2138_18405 [Deltaproteobacteria bacterium RBG_16_71_12]
MASRGDSNLTTQVNATALQNLVSGEGAAGVARLVVLGSGLPAQYALPLEGEVLIGRSEASNLRIDEDSISRRHAMLRVGERVTLEDLGSTNGSRVRDRQLKRGDIAEIIPGEAFELGKVMCIVQRKGGAPDKPRRNLKTHGYVEARLEEEIDKREGASGGIALARIHVEGHLPDGALDDAVARTLGVADIVGEYGPGELEVLFLDVPQQQLEIRCDRLVLALKGHAKKVSLGVAVWPQDGLSAAALFEHANDRVQGARAGETSQPMVRGGAMDRLKKLIERVASSDISVVLQGETGVGKEVFARELHRASERSQRPFMGINCAALTEPLLESELFGHEKGSFSGAVATKPGLLEVAEKGTVFLDEIAEMSPAIQAKLLRVLEERQVLRVGGLSPRPIDVRFLAATHRDLEEEVAAGRFRQDLYFRLNGITLDIPPLRERVEEIEGLSRTFLLDACRRQKRLDTPRIGSDALALLRGYAWPGNVRELRNVIERAVLLCTGSAITPELLPVEKMLRNKRAPRSVAPSDVEPARPATQPTRPAARTTSFADPPPTVEIQALRSSGEETDAAHASSPRSLKHSVEEVERERILEALRLCAGNQTKAAQMLGISRRTLLNRLDQYGLPRPRK